MALKTNLEMAEEFQKAITAILTNGQAYSMGEGPESKSYTRADLGTLQNAFKYYKAQADIDERANAGRLGLTFILPG